VVLGGSNVVPSIGSVSLGTTFQVVGTAPIQYSTVWPTLSPEDGLNVAFRAVGFCAVTMCACAAPDGSTNASTAPAVARIAAAMETPRTRPRSPFTGTETRCFTT